MQTTAILGPGVTAEGGVWSLNKAGGRRGGWGEAGRGAPGRMQANPQSQYNTQITCMNIIRACLG